MAAEQRDPQQRHFERKTAEEAGQTALDDTDPTLADGSDTRPGRAGVSGQADDPTPTGTVGQREYGVAEGSGSSSRTAG